ncbi:MAG: hypothetical protein ACTSRI_20560 [Promethearchaeota archaeon]
MVLRGMLQRVYHPRLHRERGSVNRLYSSSDGRDRVAHRGQSGPSPPRAPEEARCARLHQVLFRR